jgi:ribosomal protein S6--L-glutamate ligase
VIPARIGVCGEEGGWSSGRLTDAFRGLGCDVTFFEPRDCSILLSGRELPVVLHRGQPLPELAAVAVKKIGDVTHRATRTRLEVLFALEARGTLVRSRPKYVSKALNRVKMTRILAEYGVKTPATLITDSVEEGLAFLQRTGAAIFKPAFTSKGRGMHKLEASRPDEAREVLAAWASKGDEPIYLQEFVQALDGADLGVAILDGKVLGAYRRVAPSGTWLTTIAHGGSYAPAELSPELESLALRAARPFKLTFTGVDIVPTTRGPLVYEVSAFGGFRGLWETARIDAAALFARHVLEELARRPQAAAR